jgi:uncharacterized protein YndB with AHSA1/START domain
MSRRYLGAAALATAAGALYAIIIRPRHLRFGATNEEFRGALSGDELIPDARLQATRAITIDAPPEQVWPWIAQLGADRAGFYSYEWLENLVGCDIENVDHVQTEWQHVHEGDFIRADRRGTGGWYVEEVDPPRLLVLRMGEPGTGVRFDAGTHGAAFTWAFVLRAEAADRTRLLVRARYRYRPGLAPFFEAVEFADFVMTERMFRGIRERAEELSRTLAPVEPTGTAA